MRFRSQVLVGLVVVAVGGIAWAQSAESKRRRQPSWVTSEARVIQVQGITPLTKDMDSQFKEAARISAEEGGYYHQRNWDMDERYDGALYVPVWLRYDEELGLDSEKIEQQLNSFRDNLEQVIRKRHERARDHKMTALREKLELATEGLGRARAETGRLENRQEELIRVGEVYLSQEVILERLADLRDELREHEMEMRTMQARREALEKNMARISREVDVRVANDAIAQDLERMVALRLAGLVRLEDYEDEFKESYGDDEDEGDHEGADDDADKDEDEEWLEEQEELTAMREAAEEGVLEARIELAQRREMLREAAGEGLLGELNEQLVMLSVEAAEVEARYRFIRQEIERMQETKLYERAGEFEQVQAELKTARQQRAQADYDWKALERQMRELEAEEPPTVTLLGEEAGAVTND